MAHRLDDGGISVLIQFRPSLLIGLHAPKEAVTGLVSYLYPFRLHIIGLQQFKHLDSMRFKVFLHLFIGMTAP